MYTICVYVCTHFFCSLFFFSSYFISKVPCVAFPWLSEVVFAEPLPMPLPEVQSLWIYSVQIKQWIRGQYSTDIVEVTWSDICCWLSSMHSLSLSLGCQTVMKASGILHPLHVCVCVDLHKYMSNPTWPLFVDSWSAKGLFSGSQKWSLFHKWIWLKHLSQWGGFLFS